MTNQPFASRSGHSSAHGKRTESAKTLLAQPTKEALQKRAMESGMTESEAMAIILETALHGQEHVRTLQMERINRVLGIVPESSGEAA